jgi:adenylate cyclase class 2
VSEEIEAKVRIRDPEAFRRQAAARGWPAEGPVFEVNRLFDDAEGTLRRRGCAVRSREERCPDTGRVLATRLTYKGPHVPGPLKRRPEYETTVESAEPLVALFRELGLRESFRYEKRRTAWRVGACEVTLDQVPHLGWFVEVEGPSEEAVWARVADLGLDGQPSLTRSYVHLLAEHLESEGRDPTRAVFDDRPPDAG